ncbi:MAG: type IV pilin protein [Bacteroidia bacterium]
MRRVFKPQLKAFTLTELLVVLAIIGILVLIALPNLMPLISRTRSTEAKNNLGYIHSLEKTYYLEHSKYSSDLREIGFELDDPANAQYTYEIAEAGTTNFVIRATAKTDFDNDGNINVWEIDQQKNLKEVTPD